jgi:hypothetical protein
VKPPASPTRQFPSLQGWLNKKIIWLKKKHGGSHVFLRQQCFFKDKKLSCANKGQGASTLMSAQGAPKSLRAFNEEIVQLNQNPRRRSAADHAEARMARLAAEDPMCALLSLASFSLGLVAHSVITTISLLVY